MVGILETLVYQVLGWAERLYSNKVDIPSSVKTNTVEVWDTQRRKSKFKQTSCEKGWVEEEVLLNMIMA